jgi:excisionase family DNA binding protein
MARQAAQKAGRPRRRLPRYDDPRPPTPGVDALIVPEVAYLLGCSSRMVRLMIDRGQLATFRIGVGVRISRAELDAFMRRGGAPFEEDNGDG